MGLEEVGKRLFLITSLFLLLVSVSQAQESGGILVMPKSLSAQAVSDPYLIGKIAVAVIFPESDGDVENWRGLEIVEAMEKVKSSVAWWVDREPKANLTFHREGMVVPTSHEPILIPLIEYPVWVSDVMTNLGYDTVQEFTEDFRREHDADFGLTIFIVRSISTPVHSFPDGYMLVEECGQFVIITYDGGPYTIYRLDAAVAPGIGCAFCALPQWEGAQYPCDQKSGFLNVENQNSEYGDCESDEVSIMRIGYQAWQAWNEGLVDHFARGQVGWRDSDGDGVLDPVDYYEYSIYLPIILIN